MIPAGNQSNGEGNNTDALLWKPYLVKPKAVWL
jgi:hypothetical protein